MSALPPFGESCEAHLPAQCPSSSQEAWVPGPHEHSRRARRPEVATRQGSGSSLGLIGRINARNDFVRLRRTGRRIRLDPFWCTYLLDPSVEVPRVAFAINRRVGNAVTRNRLRRRARSVLTTLDLPSGLYLIGCSPRASKLAFDSIQRTLEELPAAVART